MRLRFEFKRCITLYESRAYKVSFKRRRGEIPPQFISAVYIHHGQWFEHGNGTVAVCTFDSVIKATLMVYSDDRTVR